MPKIPVIEYQTRPIGPGNQPRMSAEALGAPGAGLQQFGRTVQGAAQQLDKIRDQQAEFEAGLQLVEKTHVVRTAFDEAKKTAPEGAEGFAEQVKTKFDAWVPEAMGDAPAHTGAQKRLKAGYAQLRADITGEAMRFEAQAQTALNLRRASQATDTMANVARTEPHRIFEQLRLGRELVDSMPITDEQQRAEVRMKVEAKIYESGADGWVTQFEAEPTTLAQLDEAVAAMKEGAYDFKGKLDPKVYDGLLTRLENRKKVVEQENKTAVMYAFQDSIASIQTNGRDPGLVNREVLAKTFPKEPEKVDRMMQELASEQRMFGMRQTLATASPTEMRDYLAGLERAATGEGAAIRRQELLDAQQVVRGVITELAADPRAYFTRVDPALANLIVETERTSDPEQRKELGRMVVGKLDGWYDRMGVPTWARQYLGKGAAQQMATQLNGLGAEAAADEMYKLHSAYPTKYGQILRELDSAGLDGGFMVLGRMDTPAEAVGRKKLAEALQVGRTELVRSLGEANKADVDARVLKKLEDFNGTLAMAGTAGGRIRSNETTAMQNLSYHLVAEGQDAADAVDTAYKMLHGTKDYGVGYYTPRGTLGRVEQVERQAMSQLRPEMFQPAAIPLNATAEQRAVYESPAGVEARRRAAYEVAKRQGRWTNSPDGDGIMLMIPDDESGRGYSPARLVDGAYYERRFSDIFAGKYDIRPGDPGTSRTLPGSGIFE